MCESESINIYIYMGVYIIQPMVCMSDREMKAWEEMVRSGGDNCQLQPFPGMAFPVCNIIHA